MPTNVVAFPVPACLKPRRPEGRSALPSLGADPQGRHFRKLAMSRSPSVWLFSGWNCVPAMLSAPTIAVTGPP